MTTKGLRAAWLSAVLLCLAASAWAGEFRQEGWPLPDMAKSRRLIDLEGKKDLIKECPGQEVYQEAWAIKVGDLSPAFRQAYGVVRKDNAYLTFNVNKLDKGRKVVSYYFDLDGGSPMDLTVVDAEGQGRFQYKYSEAEVPAPAWVLKTCK